MKKQTALYARVSTEAQAEEGYSIDAQKKLLEAYCVSREIADYRFYIDAGYSGSNLDRPAIKELLSDILKGKISAVAVYKLDRLSRSQKDTLYLIEDVFNPNDVGFISLSENMDTSTPIGRAMLGIMSAFAQLERETIKMRTRLGMKERVKSGLWPGGGKIPFGYDYDKESGKLVKNSDSETVKKMYELYLAGYSPALIAKLLGIKYEKLVVQILRRETNTGVINYKGETYKGQHEAIIDTETYQKTLEEMKRRGRGVSGGVHLLSGLLFCGRCGARVRYQKWGKKGYRLVCYSQQKSKPYLIHDPDCTLKRYWADEVEKEVLHDLFSLKLEKQRKKKAASLDNGLLKKKERLEKRLIRLYELYSDGDDALIEVIKKIKDEISKTERLLNEEEKQAKKENSRENIIAVAENLEEIWETLSTEEKKRITASLVEKVVLFDEKIQIHYRFD